MGRSLLGRTPTRTGYFQRKFLHPNSGKNMIGLPGPRHKDYRLAEIYLNFAEAAMESGHDGISRMRISRLQTVG